MTFAETLLICKHYEYQKQLNLVGFRQLCHIQVNQLSKKFTSLTQLWPLPLIDGEGKDPITPEEMFERNKKIEDAVKGWGINLN